MTTPTTSTAAALQMALVSPDVCPRASSAPRRSYELHDITNGVVVSYEDDAGLRHAARFLLCPAADLALLGTNHLEEQQLENSISGAAAQRSEKGTCGGGASTTATSAAGVEALPIDVVEQLTMPARVLVPLQKKKFYERLIRIVDDDYYGSADVSCCVTLLPNALLVAGPLRCAVHLSLRLVSSAGVLNELNFQHTKKLE